MQVKKKRKLPLKGTDIVLIVIGVLIVFFVLVMFQFYYLYQSVPDSLIVAVFGTSFGELGFCTLIYKIKKGVITKESSNEEIEVNAP